MGFGTLILGVGNPLFGDDGFGIEVVRRLQQLVNRGDVDIIDGGTAGIYLIPLLENRRRVILVDAVDFKGVPGQILQAWDDEIPRRIGVRLSEHQVNLHEILALLDLLSAQPQTLELIGVQPRHFRFGEGLSPEVEAAAGSVVESLAGRLEAIPCI